MRSKNPLFAASAIFFTAVLSVAPTKSVDATIIVSFDPATTQVTTGISTFSASGETMAGMIVTVEFLNRATSSAIWQRGAGFGQAAVNSVDGSWLLYETGDTIGDPYPEPWLFQASAPVRNILINAGPGNTVLDIGWPLSVTDPNGYGTTGSVKGVTFSSSYASGLDIVVTYINQVALAGSAPIGDVWQYLNINFANAAGFPGNGFGSSGASLYFAADTDNLKIAGDLQPIPELSTPPMLLLGLATLVVLFRRRRTFANSGIRRQTEAI